MWTALAAWLAAAGPADRDAQLPAWLEGCWEMRAEARWTEECWSAPRGGMMLGYSRSGRGDGVSEWETMRIVLDDRSAHADAVTRMAFWASPNGRPGVPFGWSPSEQPGVTFHNAAHDYPQRIRYWREGATLMAEIAMEDGSRAHRWRYRRLPAR